MENDKRLVLAKLIGQYIKNTIGGHESGIYKAAVGIIPLPQKPFDLYDINKNDEMKPHITYVTIMYFNRTWESLIKRDDEYVNKIWDDLQSVMNHGVVCLIGIIARLCFEINCSLDRSKFNTSSYDKYMKVVRSMLDTVFSDEYYNIIIKMLSHNCAGEKKATPVIDEKGNRISFFQMKDPKDVDIDDFNHVINNTMRNMGEKAKYILNKKERINRCANCRKETTKKCSGCTDRYLCSRKCQKVDWKFHKNSCKPRKAKDHHIV